MQIVVTFHNSSTVPVGDCFNHLKMHISSCNKPFSRNLSAAWWNNRNVAFVHSLDAILQQTFPVKSCKNSSWVDSSVENNWMLVVTKKKTFTGCVRPKQWTRKLNVASETPSLETLVFPSSYLRQYSIFKVYYIVKISLFYCWCWRWMFAISNSHLTIFGMSVEWS